MNPEKDRLKYDSTPSFLILSNYYMLMPKIVSDNFVLLGNLFVIHSLFSMEEVT